MKTLAGTAAIGAMLLTAAPAFGAPVVSSGFQPDATDYGAVRWRNFNNSIGQREIRIGTIPLTPDGTYNVGDFTWSTANSTAVEFQYDAATNSLTTRVGAAPVIVQYAIAAVGAAVNYMRIDVCNSEVAAVEFNAVKLDGESIGNFDPAGNGCRAWSVTGIDKSGGFTLEGAIAVVDRATGEDTSLIQVRFGHYTPSAASAPAVSNVSVSPALVLLNGPATVAATVDDSGPSGGNNLIKGAEYSLNGGQWAAMDAQDGTFDSVKEDVDSDFTATQPGDNEVCVRGADELGNVSDPVCQTFRVDYRFDGFFSPIDNVLMNVAKAGQAIPVKWRLTDYYGSPVDAPTSFVGLWTYPISCIDESGTPTDGVEEYAAGVSGLQYNGDGYWQFNWKTQKGYANKCYAMYVLFDTGTTSPVVTVKFTR